MKKHSVSWFDRQSTPVQLVIMLTLIFAIRTFFFGLYQVPTGSMETTMLVGERFFADKLTIWFKGVQRNDIISFNDPNFKYSDNVFKNWWQRYVWGPSNWTKRVIGVPGDHIQGTIEDGKPVVRRNGDVLIEPYLNKYPLIAVWKVKPNFKARNPFACADYTYFSYDPLLPWDKQPFYSTIRPDNLVSYPAIPQVLEPGTPMPQSDIDVFDVQLGDNQYWVMGDNRLGSYDSRGWGVLDGQLIHGKIKFCIWSLDSMSDWWILDLLRHPIAFWTKMRWSRCLRFVR